MITAFNTAHTSQLHELFRQEWWTENRSLADVIVMLEHSDLCLGLVDDHTSHICGFARVLSDFVFKALIFDVIVAAQYRGGDLGERLMDAILNHTALQDVEHFELYCRPEMEGYYQRWDFSRAVSGVALMRRTVTN